jgi:hypothetical protein
LTAGDAVTWSGQSVLAKASCVTTPSIDPVQSDHHKSVKCHPAPTMNSATHKEENPRSKDHRNIQVRRPPLRYRHRSDWQRVPCLDRNLGW